MRAAQASVIAHAGATTYAGCQTADSRRASLDLLLRSSAAEEAR